MASQCHAIAAALIELHGELGRVHVVAERVVQRVAALEDFVLHLFREEGLGVLDVAAALRIVLDGEDELFPDADAAHVLVEVDELLPGDVGAVAKVEEIDFDAVLHDSHDEDNIHLKPLEFPQPMQGLAVETRKKNDEQRLFEILHKLESGSVPLSESMALWERGEELAAICQGWLDGAKAKIEAARPKAEG